MKTTVSLGRDGHCNEIRKTLSQALLTVALFLAAFLPEISGQCALACDGSQISLNENCQAEITPALMLADSSQCPDGVFTVYVMYLNGDTIPTSPLVTEAELGLTLRASVYDENSGNSCWDFITIEDKLPPQISCTCPDVPPGEVTPECVINCLDAIVYPGPEVTENCSGGAQTILLSETIQPICDPLYIRRMVRQYTAVDASGNYADTCTEVLYLERIDFAEITWPDSFAVINETEYACDEVFLDVNPADGIPDAAPISQGGAGVPTIDGVPIYPNFINECNVQVFYEDLIIGSFTCVRKVMRMWRAFEWHCSGETEFIYIQLIELVDNEGPEINCTDDITVSTGTIDCEATVFIPTPDTEDNCNDVVQISVSYPFGFAPNIYNLQGIYVQLPVGENLITYVAYDECFNSTICTYTVTVQDATPPVPICDEHTIVALTNDFDNGLTLVQASAFDDGSYDECGPVTFLARRMTSCIDYDWTTLGPGIDEVPDGYITTHDLGTSFHTYVPFSCCDVGAGPIMIELRVTDASGNINSCMVEIEVQDKLPPIIECMDDITISCDYDFDIDNLSQFGSIRYNQEDREEICVYDPSNPYAVFGYVCIGLDGIAWDNCDVVVTEDVQSYLNNCGIGYVVRTFTATDPGGRTDVCYQYIYIENFEPFYINDNTCFNADPNDGVVWPCDYEAFGCGGNTEPEVTGFPIITEDDCDLVGVNYEDVVFEFVQGACLKILRTWRVIDWCQYASDGEGGYYGYWEYVQIIKVVDTEPPFFVEEPADTITVCNEFNCDDLWIPLVVEGDDDCTPAEELIASCATDLFDDGVIDATSRTEDNLIDLSRFFPIGTHRVIYTFEDGCGGEVVHEQIINVLACKAPTPVCHALSADLMPVDLDNDGETDWGTVVIWATDFDASSYHACGYPITVSFTQDTMDKSFEFTCEELGLQTVQIWVTDRVLGLQDFCTTTIDIQDNNNVCEDGNQLTGMIGGQISTESTQNVKDVQVTLSGSGLQPTMTNGTGDYAFPTMPLGGTYSVTPSRNTDWKNGVSTLDLIQIQKHLLGLQPLSSPYKMIAADANKSNSISAVDIVTLRRLILGIIHEVPENTSWRFVDAAYDFNDPSNPLGEAFPESFPIAPFATTMPNVNFVGIKVGDVNNTVVANLNNIVTRSNPGTIVLQAQDQRLKAGETVEVAIQAGSEMSLEGYQFTLNFNVDGLEFEGYRAGAITVADDNFNVQNAAQGVITTSWSDVKAHDFAAGTTLFTLQFSARTAVTLHGGMQITSDATNAEAYTAEGEVLNVALKFINTPDNTPAAEFELLENTPNPFSEATMVSFITPVDAEAIVTIYDVTGKVVKELTVMANTGRNDVEIRNLNATGVLYCQVRTGEFSATRKMIRIE